MSEMTSLDYQESANEKWQFYQDLPMMRARGEISYYELEYYEEAATLDRLQSMRQREEAVDGLTGRRLKVSSRIRRYVKNLLIG